MTDTQKQDRIGEMMREYREESRRQAHAASKVRESERDQQAALIASQAKRIAELEGALAWVEPAMHALTSYEKDRGEPLPEDHQIGKIDDSRNSASFRLYVGHIRRLHSLLSRKGGE